MTSPKWADVLVSTGVFPSSFSQEPLSKEQAEQLEQIANAANSYSDILNSGVSAIGWALAATADNESFGMDADEIRTLGWLLHALGELSRSLSDMHVDASYKLQHCQRAAVQEAQE
ncbi:hypothetical protein H3222_11735 [Pseudomonas chengduensis]|nr:hypothetical protein [Pseudomonas chengduensis]MBG0845882.1 hypothetical protein [Pseudomonas chengduensis]